MKGKQRLTKEFKYAVSEEGTFEGLLATYNNIDLGGDLIEPGAFQKTIQENGPVVPLLWQHDTRQPIGSLTLTDTPEGLAVKGKILIDTPIGDYAYKTLRESIIRGLSIGYDTIKSVWEGPVRHLKEIRLWEGSIVTFGMDPKALIASVKRARETKDGFNAEFAETQLCAAGPQMIGSLQDALYSVFWDGEMTNSDKISLAQSSIQQFSDAYMAWLPDFLNWMAGEYGDMETMSLKQKERKAGREISSSNKQKLKSARDHVMSAADLISPLCSEEAGADEATTSEEEAGEKSEPVVDHSALSSILTKAKEAYQWTPSKLN